MNPVCPKWEQESVGLCKPEMEEEDWMALHDAMKAHMAVCKNCQDYEAKVFTGRSGKVPVKLYSHIADEVISEITKNQFPITVHPDTLAIITFEVTKVLEKWKLINFDENMLSVREQWAMNTPTVLEKREADHVGGS